MPNGDRNHYRIADNHPPSPAHTSDSEDTATEKWHYHIIKKFFSRWRRTAHSMALRISQDSMPSHEMRWTHEMGIGAVDGDKKGGQKDLPDD